MSGGSGALPTVLVVPWTTVPADSEVSDLSPAEMQLGVDTARALREAGVIVVVHDEPERVRFISPEPLEISGSTLLRCAMRALTHETTSSSGVPQRNRFAHEVARAIEEAAP